MIKKIVVLISGQGLTLQSLIDACDSGQINGQICAVVSNKSDILGIQRAKQANIPTKIFLRNKYSTNLEMDMDIANYIKDYNADLIVLAGYMKILTPDFIKIFEGKILNIHPSLLPKYPGLNTYQQALDAGDKEHGTTVHFVNEEVDGGAVILQAKVPIFEGDEIADIEQRVKTQEQRIYPLVVKWFIEGRLALIDNKAYLDGNILPENGYATD